jgi:hypothetical protein
MRTPLRSKLGATVAVLSLAACGGGTSTPPTASEPAPTPTPTPSLGTVRLVSMSVPPDSTLVAQPMRTSGQQVPELWATVAVEAAQDEPNAALRSAPSTPPRDESLSLPPPPPT